LGFTPTGKELDLFDGEIPLAEKKITAEAWLLLLPTTRRPTKRPSHDDHFELQHGQLPQRNHDPQSRQPLPGAHQCHGGAG
jgi:hypothetical protein